jgi:hypothetical protein
MNGAPLRAALAVVLAAAALQAGAEPDTYVRMPTVTEGERELDFRVGSQSRGEGVDRATAAALGWGYGVTSFWFTEASIKYARERGDGTRFDAVEWENLLQLSEPGEWALDTGILVEIEKPHDAAEGWGVAAGPLLQRDVGPVQLNLNLLLGRRYRAQHGAPTRLLYQAQAKYRYREPFEFGVQAFGTLGQWDRWTSAVARTNRIGPAVFGRLPLAGGRSLGYNLGLLLGTTDGSPDRTLRLQIEYEY